MSNHEAPPTWWLFFPFILVLAAILCNLWATELEAVTERIIPRTRHSPSQEEHQSTTLQHPDRGRLVRRGNRVARLWPEVSPSPPTGPRRRGTLITPPVRSDWGVGIGEVDMRRSPPRSALRNQRGGLDEEEEEGSGQRGKTKGKAKKYVKDKDVWWKKK